MYLLKDEIKEFKDNKSKMSSLSKIEQFENCDVRELGLNNKLLRSEIYTIYDLLTYSYYDLSQLKGIGDTYINQMKNIIHSNGLKFIDELKDEEKRDIISLSTQSMVNNSSLEWIISKDKSKIPLAIKETIKNIGNLKEKLSDEINLDDNVIRYALSIGIDLGKPTKVETEDFYMSYKQLLNTNIKDIKMPLHMYNKLTKYSIHTIGDIVAHKKSFFDRVFYTSTKTKMEFYKLIYNFGLFFRDDISILKIYSKDISSKFDNNEDISFTRNLKK